MFCCQHTSPATGADAGDHAIGAVRTACVDVGQSQDAAGTGYIRAIVGNRFNINYSSVHRITVVRRVTLHGQGSQLFFYQLLLLVIDNLVLLAG